MVFDDPPAPAARVEFGRDTCADPAARRLLQRTSLFSFLSPLSDSRFAHTEFERLGVWQQRNHGVMQRQSRTTETMSFIKYKMKMYRPWRCK